MISKVTLMNMHKCFNKKHDIYDYWSKVLTLLIIFGNLLKSFAGLTHSLQATELIGHIVFKRERYVKKHQHRRRV